MGLTTKTIFLTLVLVFIGSVGFAKSGTASTSSVSNAEKDRLQDLLDTASSKLTSCNALLTAGKKSDCSAEIKAQSEARDALNAHNRTLTNKTEHCANTISEINKITEKFDASAQKEALACMEAGTSNSPEGMLDLTGAVLRGLSGQTNSTQDVCRVESSKSNQSQNIKDKITAIEKLERDLEKVEEKMIDREKKANDTLSDLNEDRMKLKEAWEKRQTDQEKQQAEDVAAVRDSQIKIQEAIRKANAELIAARQDLAKAKRKRSEELLKAGVQSFDSIDRICRAQTKEYFSKVGYTSPKRAKSLSASAKSGGGKVKDVNSFYRDCLKSMDERRQAIYEDSSNYEVQMANNLKDRQEAIATLENEYKQISVSYNQALERAAAGMSKAQQAYIQNDSNLAMKINQFQIATEKERQNLENQKKLILQKLQAANLSYGKISEAEVSEGVTKMEEYMSSVESLFGDPDDPNDDCPQASRYNSIRGEFKTNRERIQEVKEQR